MKSSSISNPHNADTYWPNKARLRVINNGVVTEHRFFLHLHSYGMLRAVDWQFVTDVFGQPIGPIFRDQASSFGLLDP